MVSNQETFHENVNTLPYFISQQLVDKYGFQVLTIPDLYDKLDVYGGDYSFAEAYFKNHPYDGNYHMLSPEAFHQLIDDIINQDANYVTDSNGFIWNLQLAPSILFPNGNRH